MTEKLKLGLVGAGRVAHSYLQALRESKVAGIAAIADTRLDAAKAFAETAGALAFESHEKLAKDGGCDAVLVCTPPSTHAPICTYFLDRGIPVLCEKPIAIDAPTAQALIDHAEREGVLFTMASKFRYVEDVIRAKSILASGIVGDIVLFENAFTAHVDMSRRWNADPKISGGGVLIDNGTHSVDIVRYFLGPIAAVQAMEGKRIQGLAVEDTVRLFARTDEGVLANVDLSWSLNKEQKSYIDIYGTNGAVRIGWQESKYRQLSSQDWIVFGKGYDKVEAFRRQVENFCAALRGDERLRITAEDAMASVQVIEAAYESMHRNDWVPVASASDTPP